MPRSVQVAGMLEEESFVVGGRAVMAVQLDEAR